MKKILLIGLLLVAAGMTVAYFLYNKPHKNMERAEADLSITAFELFTWFENKEAEANEKFLDKILEVSGEIRDVTTSESGNTSITLKSSSELFGVICELDPHTEHQPTDLVVGEQITLKGICTGMLMDVVLVRCVVV